MLPDSRVAARQPVTAPPRWPLNPAGRARDDFVSIPPPRIAAVDGAADRAAVESLAAYEREVAVVDTRLARKVTLAFKATALSDLCDRVRTETGVHLAAGRSVADEKVTLFCREMPLRDVMRQLSRPFGYAWLRSGKAGDYRYELAQDLRSQLMEEELRNRDRNAALLALDQEMQRYRKYLNLSPDEARAAAAGSSGEEKKLLERYAGSGWGLIQMFFRLSPNDLNQLRAGKSVRFSAEQCRHSSPDDQPLPPDLARGVLQSQRDRRILQRDGHYDLGQWNGAEGVPPAAVPEARAMMELKIEQSELGQFTFGGGPGIFISESSPIPGGFYVFGGAIEGSAHDGLAVGQSPSVLNPRNKVANAKLSEDPALHRRVTVRPEPSCRPEPDAAPVLERFQARFATGTDPRPKVMSADVLEALHRATGLPIVADYYTRLYPVAEVSVQNRGLFDALNQLADAMRLRWSKEAGWLQFRSTGFFHDRLKEVPNRLLTRWAASRKQHGALILDDLVEIAQLSDAQLDASGMAEGAHLCFGLAEWQLLRLSHLRSHLRFVGEFTPGQRELAQRPEGLLFSQMTLPQQQGFLGRALSPNASARIEDLSGATLHIDYTLPGWFRWSSPGRVFRPSPVRERTREAALQAARRIDPNVPEEQIQPTRLDVTVLYTPNPNRTRVRVGRITDDGWVSAP